MSGELSSRNKLRVNVLRSDDAHHRYLDYQLGLNFDLQCRVIEPFHAQRKRLFQRRKFIDFIYSWYHSIRRDIWGLNRYRRSYFQLPPFTNLTNCSTLLVDYINDPKVVDFLIRHPADVTVIICTSILKAKVLKAVGKVINVHGGYLPYYRGNHCFFFAVYRGDFEHLGSTIHFVDAGVDTGDIIEVIQPDIFPSDIPETLYSRAEKLAIKRLIFHLKQLEAGLPLPRVPQPRDIGRQYFTRDRGPLLDSLMFLRRLFKFTRLPVVKNGEGANASF